MSAALVLLLGGCTDDSEPAARPSSSPSATTATPEPASAPLDVTVTSVRGKLPAPARTRVVAAARRVIGGYLDEAFLRDDYPRAHPAATTFSAFAPGLRARARRDATLLTNASYGATTESVRATRRKAALSVLAPAKVGAGVGAKVDLVFRVDRGDRPGQRVHLTGRLLLTHRTSSGWQIFGYDLARSDTPVRSGS